MKYYDATDICAHCGHTFRDHGYLMSIDIDTLEEPYRSHIDCKRIMGKDQYGYTIQCECCNFVPIEDATIEEIKKMSNAVLLDTFKQFLRHGAGSASTPFIWVEIELRIRLDTDVRT
jgi:hypothetical protein